MSSERRILIAVPERFVGDRVMLPSGRAAHATPPSSHKLVTRLRPGTLSGARTASW